MSPLPPELAEKAKKADETRAAAWSAVVPTGDFTPSVIAHLVEALNELLPMFGAPKLEPSDTLTGDIVKAAIMIEDAANRAGLPLRSSIKDVHDDAGLALLTGRIEELADNPRFNRAMQSPPPSPPASSASSASPAPPAPTGESAGSITKDKLFDLFRARRK